MVVRRLQRTYPMTADEHSSPLHGLYKLIQEIKIRIANQICNTDFLFFIQPNSTQAMTTTPSTMRYQPKAVKSFRLM